MDHGQTVGPTYVTLLTARCRLVQDMFDTCYGDNTQEQAHLQWLSTLATVSCRCGKRVVRGGW